MYKISEHKEEIITNLISNIIWYILSIFIAHILLWIPLIKGIYITLKTNEYNIPVYAFVLVGFSVLLMFITMIISIIITIKFYKGKNKNSNEIITTDLIFNNLEIELYFKDRENIFSYLTYDCNVNKQGFDKFKKNIIWTGGKYNYTKIIESNGQYDIYDSNRKSSPYDYTVNFNKNFSIGDDLYFKLETSVKDDDHSMIPIFSHVIKQQTVQFNIHLTVPKNLITNVRPTVYRDIGRTVPVSNDIKLIQKNVGDLIQYSYCVENPKLLNNYCIEWDFK